MELITRKIIMELEGEEGFDYIKEYSNTKTERGQKLRKAICEKLGFASLEFQSLDGIVEAIGLKKSELCTYCWDGVE
jgi:amidophosphoribosyltransferase